MPDFQGRAKKKSETCVHFNGVQNEHCRAGVAYESFERPGIPCMTDFCKGQVCAQRHFPTPEEVQEMIAADEAAFERTSKAISAVAKDAKSKGLKKRSGGQSSIPCPVCETGTLAYSVSGYNGHIHGRCDTPGCVWWMQ